MSISIKNISDPNIAALMDRMDSNADGKVDKGEAATASRHIRSRRSWRREAFEAFGVLPRSGAELRRFAENPPREEALERILGQSFIAGMAERSASGRGQKVSLSDFSEFGKEHSLSITPGGRVALDGKLPTNLKELGTAIYHASKQSETIATSAMPEVTQRRLFGTLSDALTVSQTGRRTISRERMFAGSMTMLLDMANHLDPSTQGEFRSAVLDRGLQALSQEKDPEMRLFYFNSITELESSMDPAQKVALREIEAEVLPKAAPIEEYTKGRTQPLVVEHTIHEEFWKEEISLYKELGFKMVKKDKKDNRRVYEGTIKDPDGKKPDMQVKVTVNKGEMDFLEKMADPKTHVVIYSGHSALGGNGSQAIADAEEAQGLPKTVLIANCRGKDNFAEFSNKFPDAMLIGTLDPTYSDSGQLRVRELYNMFSGGETFADMRNKTRQRFWDEGANNYIYPDERRKFDHMDSDRDGRADRSALGKDKLFNIEKRRDMGDFNRSIAFVNTELFYHWELEHENGDRSAYGKSYYDHIIPDGILEDPEPGELVRVEVKERKIGNKTETFFGVKANPEFMGENRDLYAGKVTAHVMMDLAEDKYGELSNFEAMRAVLAGAQGIYYLDVYEETAAGTMASYFQDMGLGAIDPKDISIIFENFDTHVNDEQTQAFVEMLEGKYGIDLDRWDLPE